jgi:sulfur-carrier protein
MARLFLTPNLKRHVDMESMDIPSGALRQALDAAFAVHPTLRGYVLDDQGHIRKHMVLFIDDQPVLDRAHLSDVVAANSEVWIFQALSGGSRA